MTGVHWMSQHRRFILLLVGLLAAGGIVCAFIIPVGLFPNVAFPRVFVSLDAGDRPVEAMAKEVTWPVEEAIRSMPGVREVWSDTSRGEADININFTWGDDLVAATLQVESAINQLLPSLPQGTSFTVRRMDPTVFPALAYSLTSETESPAQLHDLAQYQLRPLLSTVTGVARVVVKGGATAEYQVTVDPARLEAYGLSFDDVVKTIAAQNEIEALGRLEDHYKLYLVLSDTRLRSLDDIRDTTLHSGKGSVVRLSDIADVQLGTEPQWTRVAADGRDAVLININQQPGGNLVQIAHDIKEQLAAHADLVPKDVRIANWYDQSELVVASAHSVRDVIVIGVILAAIVLLVFLRNAKVMLIAIIAAPAVLCATVLLLYALKMSFNVMTLGGMAAAVGLIIDDMVVMIEHIMRRLRNGEGNHSLRIHDAAQEFLRPLAGSSASTIVIFAPLAFLSGVTGAFFKALSLTMAAGLTISFLVAWLAAPILADFLLTERDAEAENDGALSRGFHRVYEMVMRPLLAYPWFVLLLVAPLALAGYTCYQRVGSGFMPVMDEGSFIFDYVAPAGTSLAETDRLMRKVEDVIASTPDVKTYARQTGIQLGGMLTEANQGDMLVRLKPFPRRAIDEVMKDIRERVESTIPGLEIETTQLMEDLIGDLTAVPQPIEIKLFSDDGALLSELGPKVAKVIGAVTGVVEVKDGIVLAGDAIQVRVDPVKASMEDMAPDEITKMAQNYMDGAVATQIQDGPKRVGVRVWTPASSRGTLEALERLQIRAGDGHLFPLGRVATLTQEVGQPHILRDNLKRMVAVTARISDRDMGSAVADVKEALDKSGVIPKGVYYTFGGLYAEQQKAFTGLLAVFVSAVALVFLLLLLLYQRFNVAIAMMLTSLLTLSAVFIGLWLTDTELNISSMMGMTMTIGIVTEVAIFYFSEYHDLPESEDRTTRLIQAGKNRMRPIAMTTLAAILALAPLALGVGQGSAMQRPLAIAIISGLVLQLPLALVALPAFLALFSRKHSTVSR